MSKATNPKKLTRMKNAISKLTCLIMAIILTLSLNSTVLARAQNQTTPEADQSGLTIEFCENWEDDCEIENIREMLQGQSGQSTQSQPDTVMMYYFGWYETITREVPRDSLDEAFETHATTPNRPGITALDSEMEISDIVVLYFPYGDELRSQGVPAEILDETITNLLDWDENPDPFSQPHNPEYMHYFGWDSPYPQVIPIQEFYESILPRPIYRSQLQPT
ncbi:MAG: hypothetical protein FWE42_09110 [Defluviitaleaceae bacterium]|nr:hypothetical protein [Defluviitaleaceae bacterium]